jgi:hypothetical protein
MNIPYADNRAKMDSFLGKLITELLARCIKYKKVESMATVIEKRQTQGRRYRLIDVRGLRAYLEAVNPVDEEGDAN